MDAHARPIRTAERLRATVALPLTFPLACANQTLSLWWKPADMPRFRATWWSYAVAQGNRRKIQTVTANTVEPADVGLLDHHD